MPYSSPEWNDDRIELWRFDDAPKQYRDLSDNGGDEDWLALVPPALLEHVEWMWGDGDHCPRFGWVRKHDLPDGLTVFIFSHA